MTLYFLTTLGALAVVGFARINTKRGPTCYMQWLRGAEELEQQRIAAADPSYHPYFLTKSPFQKRVYERYSGIGAIGRRPSRDRRVLFIHIGKAGGSTTEQFLKDSGIPYEQVHTNAVLPDVAAAPSFSQTLVTVRDPISRFSSALDYGLKSLEDRNMDGRISRAELFAHLTACFPRPTLEVLVEFHERESSGFCWSVVHDMLVLHERHAEHMRHNYCSHVGGVLNKLKNIWVAQQESLTEDLEAFRANFRNSTVSESPSRVKWVSPYGQAGEQHPHANISDASLRALSAILRDEYAVVNAVMAISRNKHGVVYEPPFP